VILCDSHCYWAQDYSDTVLHVSTKSVTFWDNVAPMVTVLNLLLDSVTRELGDAVATRLDRITELQDRLGAFED